ncbi:hypothetical protein BFP72_15375 [Reichenbachiella sp. 5M10]|uniref:toxin-antitoxin system YwqK family antitoxin n=1 Tax=Reichenbachiella sp. 5M10 TaxID=1889772 RepID=UPI000C14FC11|nr:hypothetical protein [Reichenbachiella sp. 5M10]PIB36684.1 hypothetical protein BFP72_15375 [Reichenbachiella sp. 5M10]
MSPTLRNSYLPTLVLALLFSACQNFSLLPKEQSSSSANQETVTDGLKTTYRSNGSLYSEVMLKNGIKHGLSKSYYEDGSVQLELYYHNGKKDSISRLYYRDGSLKRTTQYKEGRKNGLRKSYFINGNPSAQMNYLDDMPASDLVEYYKSGNPIPQPKIQVSTEDFTAINGLYEINIQFEGQPKNSVFYIGKLKDGKYLDEDLLERIPGNGKVASIKGSLLPGHFLMEKLHIVGEFKTKKGNTYVTTTTYNLAIGG